MSPQHYVEVPEDIRALQNHHWWWQGMRGLYRTTLTKFVPSSGSRHRVIDIGCGYGANLEVLKAFGDVVGLDPSLEALRTISDRPSLGLVQARAEALPFRSDSFDMIGLFAVIEHVKTDQQALEESYRLARPGAIQLLLTSAYMFLWSHHDVSNGHYRRYLARQVEDIERAAGWRVIQTSYLNSFILPAVTLVRVFQRWLDKAEKSEYDMGPDIKPLSRIFRWLLHLETRLIVMRRMRLPFGVDIFSITRRDD